MVKRIGIPALLLLIIVVVIWWFAVNRNNSTGNQPAELEQGTTQEQESYVDQNLKNSIEVFLTQWQKDKQVKLILPADVKAEKKTGYYVYAATIGETDKLASLKASGLDVKLPLSKVATYQQFSSMSSDLSVGSTALAIIEFKENSAISASTYQLKSPLGVLTKTLAVSSIKEDGTAAQGQTTEQASRSYKDLSADQWRGMTLLTAREIKKKNMAPVVSVPTKNIVSKEYLTGTYYYLIGGVIKSGGSDKTTLTVQDSKTVTADFGVPSVDTYLGQPVWLHIVTHNGSIQNIEVQSFAGADTIAMLAGMNAYIQAANLE